MAAALAARAVGIDPDEIREAVLRFRGLPHRLERIDVGEGVAFYNDSKATTPAAAAAAVESVQGPIHWIAGGKETGESFLPVAAVARGKVTRATLFGECGARIAEEIRRAVPRIDLRETLEEAMEDVEEGTVLFSPGCPSYDQYLNYEERGEDFRRLSRRLAARGPRRS
jgi:UDP-N-acetylmuramoylalanine--D-glutamate ligase